MTWTDLLLGTLALAGLILYYLYVFPNRPP